MRLREGKFQVEVTGRDSELCGITLQLSTFADADGPLAACSVGVA